MSTASFLLAAAQVLAPERDTIAIVEAISDRVDAERPLFAADESRLKTASLVLSVAFREGSLGSRVEGDHVKGAPTSWCTMQVNLSPGARTLEGWTGPDLRDDPAKCVTVGMRLLRDSMRWCPSAPVAIYAAGPRGCTDARAKRISADRMALAAKLLRTVAATERTSSLFLPTRAILPHEHLLREAVSPAVVSRLCLPSCRSEDAS